MKYEQVELWEKKPKIFVYGIVDESVRYDARQRKE
jgi:hypothetical protein